MLMVTVEMMGVVVLVMSIMGVKMMVLLMIVIHTGGVDDSDTYW